MGNAYSKPKMEEALKGSLLSGDVEMLEWGIETNVSELSESLKIRLSLARAIYQDCDIVLVDDIFSMQES